MKIDETVELLKKSRSIVALTGAGISVESGIPAFRGKGGLWEKLDPMEFAHIRSFHKDPAKVWNILLSPMKDVLDKAEPNPGHKSLKELEDMGKLSCTITQNIDGLHQKAGCKNVVEFHGTFAKIRCAECHKKMGLKELSLKEIPPRCSCGGLLRPDFVFFGEGIEEEVLEKAQYFTNSCDLMLIIGTSAEVWPAAQLPHIAKARGAKLVEINPKPTNLTRELTDIFLKGQAGLILPELIKKTLA